MNSKYDTQQQLWKVEDSERMLLNRAERVAHNVPIFQQEYNKGRIVTFTFLTPTFVWLIAQILWPNHHSENNEVEKRNENVD